jgi:hypothetical protein
LALIGLFRSRASLKAEILTLCHQLNVLRRKSPQRLSLGKSQECLAAGAHPFFDVRALLPVACRDADVFPQRSPVRVRPDFQFGAGRKSPDAHGVQFDLDSTQPDWALAYRFNIVLRGRNATPLETHR